MMQDFTFRQSLSSTAKAIGLPTGTLMHHLPKVLAATKQLELPTGVNPSSADDLPASTPENPTAGEGASILEISTGFGGFSAKAHTIDLNTVIALWEHLALSDSKYRQGAARLLAIGSKVSLEQRYREVFNVEQDKPLQDQLLDAWLDLDKLSNRPLLADPIFRQQFQRVTGYAIGDRNPYLGILLSDLIWHRLPIEIVDTMRDLNPITTVIGVNSSGEQYGYRKNTFSSMLSDQAFRDAVQPIIACLTGVLSACPDKEQGGVKACLKIMDTIYIRHRKRGGKRKVLN